MDSPSGMNGVNRKGWLEVVGIGAAAVLAQAVWRRKKLAPNAMLKSPSKYARTLNGSNLREPGRKIFVVTTAALPWLTGTSVNPLLRVAYLKKALPESEVVLVLPWLEPSEQHVVFPAGVTFQEQAQQEAHIREWLAKRVDFDVDSFGMLWYPSSYDSSFGSIFPDGKHGDITSVVPHEHADVAVLEEPEHLNWFNSGRRWVDTFQHVVGVCHTNYLEYARRDRSEADAKLLERINLWMVQMHCHKVIKLSDAVQTLPRSVTCNVHGVSSSFLSVGDKVDMQPSSGIYFIGKAIWGKGYGELLELLSSHKKRGASPEINLDVYGSGENLEAIKAEAKRLAVSCTFHGRKDHLDPEIHRYRCFINPSTSDVVATTSAEALAMGKWIVVPDHPENEFFSTFHNCLLYASPEEFSKCVARALAEPPSPLTTEERYRLTWEAATERFLDVAQIKPSEWPDKNLGDHMNSLTYVAVLEMLKTVKSGINLGKGVGQGFRKTLSKDNIKQLWDKQARKQQKTGVPEESDAALAPA